MIKNMNELANKREKELLDMLWKADKAMTSMDMLNYLDEDNWNKLSVFRTVNGLLSKELIKVDGLEQNKTQYARTYLPAVTKEEYAAMTLENDGFGLSSIDRLAQALYKRGKHSKKEKEELVNRLQSIIDEIR
jgi:predicted transcriptional regulator